MRTHAPWFVVFTLVPLMAVAQGGPGAGAGLPRVVVGPIRGGVAAPTEARDEITRALEARGLTVVPRRDYRLPRLRTDEGARRELARAAREGEADAAVDLELEGTGRSGHELVLRVVEPDGTVRFTGGVALEGRSVAPTEAETVSGLVTLWMEPGPLPPPPAPAAPERPGTVTPPEITVETPPAGEADPSVLERTRFEASIQLHVRNAFTRAAAPLPDVDFGTSAPYFGGGAAVESFPLPGELGRRLGFEALYSYGRTRLTFPSSATLTSTFASDHQLTAGLLGRVVALFGGEVYLHGGLGYQGFLFDAQPPVVPTSHTGLRFAAEYRRPLVRGIDLTALAGFMPLVRVGGGLEGQYGPAVDATGFDGRLVVSGSLATWLPGLRWQAGYDFDAFRDRFSGTPGIAGDTTFHAETYHRLVLGAVWQQPR